MEVAPQVGGLGRTAAKWGRALAAAGVAACLTYAATGQSHASGGMPLLTTIRSVKLLRFDEAARALPVHVVGVITYYDPYLNFPRRPIVMVADATGSIYVALPGATNLPLRAGDLVEIDGKSGPGDFAPIIDNARIRIVGQAALPRDAPRETLTHLLTGAEDARWVEVEGVVESVEQSGMNETLKLALADGEMAATTVRERGADYERLIDAKVRIRGSAGSLFNRRSQLIGVQLLFPGLATVVVEEPAPENPFELPLTGIGDLMRYTPGDLFRHRVHIRGIVTLFWPARLLCIQNGALALCAETRQTTPLHPGDLADVVGFPQIGNVTPSLGDAAYRSAPHGQSSAGALHAAVVDASQAFAGDHDAQLIQIDGRLIAYDRASQDPTLVLTAGNFTFPVILARSEDARALLQLEEGSELRTTGICLVHASAEVFTRHDGYPVAKYFQIMLRSANDVTVLKRPSWWTVKHVLYILALALALTICILSWVVYLRIRLKQQTRLLLYQATHDELTGIWNRKAVLDLLGRESEIAARNRKRVGVMMVDADHFKAVNDTHGHLAGDSVLKEIPRRIQEAIRSYDVTGRYGGEEFLILLPDCLDEDVSQCAERVRAAIAYRPINAGGTDLAITVSIGTAILDPAVNTERDALAAADEALYKAKRAGRNRVVASTLLSHRDNLPVS